MHLDPRLSRSDASAHAGPPAVRLLIAVRSGGASDAHEVSRYGLAGHDLWLACSVLALVLLLGLWAVNSRTPEMRQEYAQAQLMRDVAINTLLVVSLVVTLFLVALGVVPDQEPALHLTAVELGLLATALTLLLLVFSQRRPQAASDPAALPPTGGSST